MESKEKAIELYNKLYNTSSHPHHIESRQQFAKQCALIALDEILEVLELIETPRAVALSYWYYEVKQEIVNL